MERILFLSSLWPPVVLGGAEIYASRLAAEMKGRGSEIGVVTLGVDGDDVLEAVEPRPYGLHEFAAPPRRRRIAYHLADLWRSDVSSAIERAVRSFRPDVVHSHAVEGLSSAALATPSRLGVPHVHTVHDYWLLCQRTTMVTRRGERCDGRCAGCRSVCALRTGLARRGFPHVVVAPSEAVAAEHLRFSPARDRLRVVRHPIEAARPAVRRTGATRFGYLGQLLPIKGLPTLLRAFRRLDDATATLVVAGTGPLAEMAQGHPDPRVEYVGWIDDAGRDAFFDDVDCLVVPSEWKEPAPLVINEAAARGVPVIATHLGGMPELVPAICRELLAAPGDEEGLLRSLERFARQRDRYVFQAPSRPWDEHLAELGEAYAAARRAT